MKFYSAFAVALVAFTGIATALPTPNHARRLNDVQVERRSDGHSFDTVKRGLNPIVDVAEKLGGKIIGGLHHLAEKKNRERKEKDAKANAATLE